MTIWSGDRRAGEAGFTLIETLIALALTGLLLSALATITSQWMPNWNRGMVRVQRAESIGLAMQRICDDLAAAEYVSANRAQSQPLFDGSELSVVFVRTASGPNTGSGLEIVRIGETSDRGELVTVRSRSLFRPFELAASLSEQIRFSDPVVLLRAPVRLSFAYADRDLVWKTTWHEGGKLPTLIALTARDATTQRILSVSTVATIHAEAYVMTPAQNPGNESEPDNGDRDRSQ